MACLPKKFTRARHKFGWSRIFLLQVIQKDNVCFRARHSHSSQPGSAFPQLGNLKVAKLQFSG